MELTFDSVAQDIVARFCRAADDVMTETATEEIPFDDYDVIERVEDDLPEGYPADVALWLLQEITDKVNELVNTGRYQTEKFTVQFEDPPPAGPDDEPGTLI